MTHEQENAVAEHKSFTRDEILQFNEQRKNDRIAKASDRNAFVAIPEGGESQVFYSLGRSVDAIFRTSRRQELKLNVIPILEMEATLEYKKALVEFSAKLSAIGKKLGKDYSESPIIKDFRKNIESEESALNHIKETLMPSEVPSESSLEVKEKPSKK